jgi:hypothetical protein
MLAWLNHGMSVSAVLMWQSAREACQDARGGAGGGADLCGAVSVRASASCAATSKRGGAYC